MDVFTGRSMEHDMYLTAIAPEFWTDGLSEPTGTGRYMDRVTRICVDECSAGKYLLSEALEKLGCIILRPESSMKDPNVVELAESNNAILITHDDDFFKRADSKYPYTILFKPWKNGRHSTSMYPEYKNYAEWITETIRKIINNPYIPPINPETDDWRKIVFDANKGIFLETETPKMSAWPRIDPKHFRKYKYSSSNSLSELDILKNLDYDVAQIYSGVDNNKFGYDNIACLLGLSSAAQPETNIYLCYDPSEDELNILNENLLLKELSDSDNTKEILHIHGIGSKRISRAPHYDPLDLIESPGSYTFILNEKKIAEESDMIIVFFFWLACCLRKSMAMLKELMSEL